MCRKRKKQDVSQVVAEETAEVTQPAEAAPIVPTAAGDYFTEYYKAYKNDYIEQYLRAYHKFKETGEEDDLVRELQGFDTDFSTKE